MMRADLHVHSYHSGYAGHLRFLRARDCYSEPEAVYRVAKGFRTVGEILNTTEETAKNTLFRATQKLRGSLADMR